MQIRSRVSLGSHPSNRRLSFLIPLHPMPFVNSSPIKLFGPIFNRSFLRGQTSHLAGDSYPNLSRLFAF